MLLYLYAHDVNIELNGKLPTILLTTILFMTGTTFLFYSISRKVELGIMNTVRTALQIILTVLLGYLYFNERFTCYQIIGSGLIILGMLMVYNSNELSSL
jgi:drug/metabolite transporter (DMT)-like permease